MILLLQSLLLATGTAFFLVGAIGVLRFPDAYCRMHALTKVDNLGLGLIVLGLLPSAPGIAAGLKLLLVWALALGASATMGHLVAHAKFRREHPLRQAGEQRTGEQEDF